MTKLKLILLSIILLAFILRFYKLGENPPSLYWDEVSLGYNAWSISETLRDEHGDFLPLTNFKAFGDYKPPGYIYLAAVSIKLFGPSEFAVRLPSALFGVIAVICTYFFVEKLIEILFVEMNALSRRRVSLVSALMAAVSPWTVNLSRVAFEANVAWGLFLTGFTLFLYHFVGAHHGVPLGSPWRAPTIRLLLTAIFFVLPFYTFNSSRIFIPLFLLLLMVFFRQTILSKKIFFTSCFLLFTIFLLPLVPHLFSEEGQLRFQEVNIFTNPQPVVTANERIAQDKNAWWSKIINNRRVYYALDYTKHFSDNFKPDFLFLSGDVNGTFSTHRNGQLLLWDAILILAGASFLWFRGRRLFLFLAVWFVIGVAPGGLARETPHALRTMNLLPTYQIFAAGGLVFLCRKTIHSNFIKITAIAIFMLGLFFYLFNYYKIYPVKSSYEFQYGYKQLVQYTLARETRFDKIFVSSIRGRPYIYFLFYGKIPQEEFVRNSEIDKDNFGFYNVRRIKNIYFGYGDMLNNKNSLFVAAPEEFGKSENLRIIKKIKFLDARDNFWIVRN